MSPASDCRKTSILINVPIKSAGKFEYRQSKGDAFSCKASPLEKQPTGLFYQFTPRKCAFDGEFSLTAVSDQRLCLWIPPAYLKNCWTKKLLVQKSLKDFFDKLKPPNLKFGGYRL